MHKKGVFMKNYIQGLVILYAISLFCSLLCTKEHDFVIEKHVKFLSAINCSRIQNLFLNIYFEDELLAQCIKDIETTRTFFPLLSTWYTLKATKASADQLGQFSLILISCYHMSISCYGKQNRFPWLSIIALYSQLNAIPLKKLFDVLDECYQHYKIIIESLPGDKNQSWNSWFEEYWWAPAMFMVFTLYSYINWKYSQFRLTGLRIDA